MNINKNLVLRSIAVTIAAIAVVGVCASAFVAYEVRFGDQSGFAKEAILAKLTHETPIFYLDGKTQLGSFFDSEHRQYVTIDQVPENLIHALVSSEDQNFFHHKGVDVMATAKAFLEGLSRAHFRRAGSSITQQTVKILYNDWHHSFSRKISEAISALKLERLYTKREILEFYLNQFHVTGNGNGIGIAARYYFNKDVSNLDIIESAFIAGSVKNPTKYNPFTKTSERAKQAAERASFERKNYVLRRMREDHWIADKDFEELLAKPVPFNRGDFRSGEVALIELVRRHLENPEILDKLGIVDTTELTHAGIKIYTTIDGQMQADAQLAVRRNLSRLDTVLNSYEPEPKEKFHKISQLIKNEFYYGMIESVHRDANSPSIKVNFGLPKGTIAPDSLQRFATTLNAGSGKGAPFHLKELLNTLVPGSIVLVQVLSYDTKTHEAVLDLQKRPEINGGLIAVDKGEIRAVVSGFDTAGYNRAIFGTRQPGSVFKSVVYYAALQLGWSILDTLQNEAQIFPYQGRFYYPHGAHESPYDDETMLYAGTESENIATVYLTAHLLDRITFDDFKKIMELLKLTPEQSETRDAFLFRVARNLGVTLDQEGIREQQFYQSISDVAPDLIFSGQRNVLTRLRDMWWGKGYERELTRLVDLRVKPTQAKDRWQKINLVANNYLRLRSLQEDLVKDWSRIQVAVENRGAAGAMQNPAILSLIRRFSVLQRTSRPDLVNQANATGLSYWGDFPDEARQAEGAGDTRTLTAAHVTAIWGSSTDSNGRMNEVRLNGYMSLPVFAALTNKVEVRTKSANEIQDAHGIFQLFQHHDTRVAVGLNYLTALSRSMGVQSHLTPVLSFGLGTNAVSLAELAMVYQTFKDGKVYRFFESGPPNQLNLIRRIEAADGTLLYEAERQETQLVAATLSQEIQEILRKVVTNGTASILTKELRAPVSDMQDPANADPKSPPQKIQNQLGVPAYGKTGTTNDFTNGTFAGLLPYPTQITSTLDVAQSYAIATYAGFDGNRPMRKGPFHGYGGQVALPAWSEFARSVIEHRDFGKFIDILDLRTLSMREWPLKVDAALPAFDVDLVTGTIISGKSTSAVGGESMELERKGEQASKSEILAKKHQVTVRIPGDAVSGTFTPLRTVQLFKTNTSEGWNDSVDPNVSLSDDANPLDAYDTVPSESIEDQAVDN